MSESGTYGDAMPCTQIYVCSCHPHMFPCTMHTHTRARKRANVIINFSFSDIYVTQYMHHVLHIYGVCIPDKSISAVYKIAYYYA